MAILKSLIVNGVARVIGDLTASKIIKQGGVSSLFLKADGSVDSTSYYHSGNKPSLSDLGAASAGHTHSYLPLAGGTMTGDITMNGMDTNINWNVDYLLGWARDFIVFNQHNNSSGSLVDVFHISGYGETNGFEYAYIGIYNYYGNNLRFNKDGTITIGTGVIWHSNNDGSGSGLDADTLDGYHALDFSLNGHTHAYLSMSGGTMTGSIKFNSSALPQKTLQYVCGIDAFANGGELGWMEGNSFVNQYAPTLTGTGASGTWGINISGNSATATNADKVDGQHFNWNNNKNDHTYLWAASDNGQAYLVNRASISVNYASYSGYSQKLLIHDVRNAVRTPHYFDSYRVTSWFNNTGTPNNDWWSGIHVKGWDDGYTSWELCSYSSTGTANDYDLYFRSGNNDSWGNWKTIITSGNIGSQHVSYANSAGSVAWGNVTGKPSTFTPSAHEHTYIKSKDNYTFTSSTLPKNFDFGVSAGFVSSDSGFGNYGSVLTVRTYDGGGGSLQLYAPYSNTYGGSRLKARFGNYDSALGNSWTALKEIAWLEDIPTSLPANGGNADTVDNLHASAFAHIGAHNNLIADGNEFTFASSGFSGTVWLNYRTAGGTNGNITEYWLGNGAGSKLGTIIHSGNYNSYAPKLDGTGAIGNWPINITGNSATSNKLTTTTVFTFGPNNATYCKIASINIKNRYSGGFGLLKFCTNVTTSSEVYFADSFEVFVHVYQLNPIGEKPVLQFKSTNTGDAYDVIGILNYSSLGSTFDIYAYGKNRSYHGLLVSLVCGNITISPGTYISALPSGTQVVPLPMGNSKKLNRYLDTDFWKKTELTKVSQLTNDAGYKTTDTTYSTATSNTLGLVKIGYTANGKNYPVLLSNGQMYVNVPWTDTNTNTWRPITDSYSGTDSNTSLSQKGGKAIYDALINGYATSAGSSTYSNTLEVLDVRGSDIIPSKFDSHRITGWFNESTGLLSGNWCSGITVKGWSDGYSSWLLAGYSSTDFGSHGLFFREAANYSGWRDWVQVITSDNISSLTVAIANLARTLSLDGTIKLYVHNTNELNFGGTNNSTTIYFGYRTADSRAIPTSFIFGGSAGSASLTANGFIKKDSSDANVLLGGGGHKALSLFVQTSGDQSISGTKTFTGTIKVNRAESTTGFFLTSDIRYKNIIESYYSLSDKIAQLPIIKYKWIDRNDNSIYVGSSALSVMSIIPELVSYDDNTDFYSLDYATLGAVAGISACKEVEILKQKIKELELEIIILKSKYNG